MGYKYHLNRHNVEVYRLCALIQQMEVVMDCRFDYRNRTLWEQLNTKKKCFNEAFAEDPVWIETLRMVNVNGKFDCVDFSRAGCMLLVNEKELWGECNFVVSTLLRTCVIEIYNQADKLYYSDKMYFKSKKKFLRMLKRISDTKFNDYYSNPEWFFTEMCKPILNELAEMKYRRENDYWYY